LRNREPEKRRKFSLESEYPAPLTNVGGF